MSALTVASFPSPSTGLGRGYLLSRHVQARPRAQGGYRPAVTLGVMAEPSAEQPAAAEERFNPLLDRSTAEQLARTLRAVADPTRLQVLSLLNAAPNGEAVVRDLVEPLGLRQPTISHHLRIMFEEGLLTREPRGREVVYAIAADRRAEIADLLR